MSLNPGFRRAAFAAALTGMSVLPMFSASAQEVKGSPACAEFAKRTDADPSSKNFKAEFKCELHESDLRIKGYNAEAAAARQKGVDADRRGAEAEAATACLDFLIAGVKIGSIDKAEIYNRAGGKDELKKGDTACVVAKSFGYRHKAGLPTPRVN
jgi:hypothetical protein